MKTRHVRAGPKFWELRNDMKAHLERIHGRRVSDREITDAIGEFWEKEKLNNIVMNRARRKGGGLF